MQEAWGLDKGISYCFVYMETIKKILIWKDNVLGYRIKVLPRGVLVCDCFGSRRHGHCKHIDFCSETFSFNKVVKPKGFISQTNEAYITENLKIEEEGFYGEKRVYP
uniref:SWIM-type domain-containing protein n=1 Tax=viral metagenome TaxID=1070528 RepID=A0A6H2A1X6_9ZZZZ